MLTARRAVAGPREARVGAAAELWSTTPAELKTIQKGLRRKE
jgi:hypothetical protein